MSDKNLYKIASQGCRSRGFQLLKYGIILTFAIILRAENDR